MIACYAWTNTQIINITNTKINLYPDDQADLYIRMGAHMSEKLVRVIRDSGVFRNVFCMDPISINYNKLKLGFIPNVRVLFLRDAYHTAYSILMNHLCPNQKYDRVLLAWFYTENVFLLDYWSRFNEDIKVTFVDEGTGSYCYTKKQMCFPLSLIKSKKEKLKRYLSEYSLSMKFSKKVDTICFYRPEYCRPDIDYNKLTIPPITPEGNPIMHDILCKSVAGLDSTHFMRYEKRNMYYLSTYSVEGAPFDWRSIEILETIERIGKPRNVIAKIHMGNSAHGQSFAKSKEDIFFVDRERYIFEGLYAQIPDQEKKVFISCVSTAAISPKFMFGVEPYVIFTYRLYDTYKQLGIERDDWMAEAVRKAYTDKSKVMIPNSMQELGDMLAKARAAVLPEYSIPAEM